MKKRILITEFKFIIIILSIVMLFSCATPAQRKQRFVASHPQTREGIKDAVLRGTVLEGMSKDAVRASWGKPRRSYKKKFGSLTALHWEYDIEQPDSIDTFLLIFRDDMLLKMKLKHSKPKQQGQALPVK